MRLAIVPFLILAPLTAASVPIPSPSAPMDVELQRARAEAEAADAQVRKLQQAADEARDAAAKLHAQQLGAAEAIAAAEARISAADAEVRLTAAKQGLLHQQLQREQQPISSLLAGLAMMARRPPLLTLADGGSTDDLVRVRVLLDSTLPVIRARTAGLSHQLAENTKLQKAAVAASSRLQSSQAELRRRRSEFAALERQALRSAADSSGQALAAGDTALAAGENVASLASTAESARAGAAVLTALLSGGEPPARPVAGELETKGSPLSYLLPANAPVSVGLGAVSTSGVRSRGLVFATASGTPVRAPADGAIRFAGPFRDFDGIVIIDHGGGWMSLLVNVATQLRTGDHVRAGDALGRAMGPLEVELSRQGRHFSPAIIAGSSVSLSKGAK
jgi:septal ring factor EnvC (AmiA/AmiB activator)